MINLPEGFDVVVRPHAQIWVRHEARDWVEGIMSMAPTLHAAGSRLGGVHKTGRGPVYAVPTPLGVWVIRHFIRGGTVAWVLGDRYLASGTPRPFAEAAASELARRHGIATPRVMAAAVYGRGPFYRGDLVTELVPDSEELADILFDDRPAGLAATTDRKEALAETGRMIRELAKAGIGHADLNARNVLIRWSGGAPTAYVLDLDRSRVATGPISVDAMVRRLIRSLRKLERRTKLKLPQAEITLLVEAASGFST